MASQPEVARSQDTADHNEKSPNKFLGGFMCAYVTVGGFLFGYDSGYINGVLAMNQFKLDLGSIGTGDSKEAFQGYNYSAVEKSLTVSLLSLGTFTGALCAGPVADRVGRRWAIIIGCIVFIIGVVIQDAAQSFAPLIVGRAIAGFGVGFISCVSITYASETAPKAHRGKIIGAYQWMITFGLLVSSSVTFATKDKANSGAYRIPISLQFAWALVLGIGMFFLPESPRWCVMKEKDDVACSSLATLRGLADTSPAIVEEVKEIKDAYDAERAVSSGWLNCFKGGFNRGSHLHRTIIGCTLQIMQQLTGVNFIFYFGTTFFKSVGIDNPFQVSIILAAVNAGSTATLFFTIDRFGRRTLLLYGSLLMALFLLLTAIIGTVLPPSADHQNTTSSALLITLVALYIFSFASTWGPSVWTLTGELFPLAIRSRGIALSVASNWLANFVIAFVTPYLVDEDKADLGAKVFFIWGSTCAAGWVYVYWFVPETKGLSLEDVDKMMVEVSARESGKWGTEKKQEREEGLLVGGEELGRVVTETKGGTGKKGFAAVRLWPRKSSGGSSPIPQGLGGVEHVENQTSDST